MLVLSRKPGERIRISDNIVLTVVAVRGNQVRLGIEAPPSVVVRREELCEPSPGAEATPPPHLPSPPRATSARGARQCPHT